MFGQAREAVRGLSGGEIRWEGEPHPGFEVRKICREGEHQRFCRIQVKPQEREVTSDIFTHVCALTNSTLSVSLKHGWSNKNPIDCFHNYHPINFYQNVQNFAVISYNFQHCVCSFIKWQKIPTFCLSLMEPLPRTAILVIVSSWLFSVQYFNISLQHIW